MENGDPSLPTYSEEPVDIKASIEELIGSLDESYLPVTSFPSYVNPFPPYSADYQDFRLKDDARSIQRNIVDAFFNAIETKNDELVAMMIEKKLVTPETTNRVGTSPLIQAVAYGNVRTVQCLVDFEAEIDRFAMYGGVQRTPLQIAAGHGNLALVRLFMEVFHADDAIVAPDGEIALRLAAKNDQADVVAYLPARRLGGWQRWKTQHAKAVKRIIRSLKSIGYFFKCVLWYFPKLLVWDAPKHCIVLPIKRGSVWAWKNRGAFPAWCKKTVQKIPGAMKKVFVDIKYEIKKIPERLRRLGNWLWKLVTERIPKALKMIWTWLQKSVITVGTAIGHLFQRLGSFLHTVFAAIASFFKSITLKDVWNGFCNVLHAVFVDFPVKLWSWLGILPEATYKLFKTLFGVFGQIIHGIGYVLFFIAIYVPRKLWTIVESLGQSMMKGFREIRVWFSPKTMGG